MADDRDILRVAALKAVAHFVKVVNKCEGISSCFIVIDPEGNEVIDVCVIEEECYIVSSHDLARSNAKKALNGMKTEGGEVLHDADGTVIGAVGVTVTGPENSFSRECLAMVAAPIIAHLIAEEILASEYE